MDPEFVEGHRWESPARTTPTPDDPSTRIGASSHPVVEFADQVDALAFGAHTANDTADDAVGGVERTRMRAEDLPKMFVTAFGKQVKVDL